MAQQSAGSDEVDQGGNVPRTPEDHNGKPNVEAIRVLEAILARDPQEQRAQWERFKAEIDGERSGDQRLFR